MSHDVQIVPAPVRSSNGQSRAVLPAARVPVHVRPATMDDLAFIDALQKKHTHMVGWMPTQQLEGKIRLGHVLVAWAPRPRSSGCEGTDVGGAPTPLAHDVGGAPTPLGYDVGGAPTPLGYCIGHDQYFKRDDVGIIYQLNVVPERRRSLIGATLIKAMFDRAAYGCKLFCCWCAQ